MQAWPRCISQPRAGKREARWRPAPACPRPRAWRGFRPESLHCLAGPGGGGSVRGVRSSDTSFTLLIRSKKIYRDSPIFASGLVPPPFFCKQAANIHRQVAGPLRAQEQSARFKSGVKRWVASAPDPDSRGNCRLLMGTDTPNPPPANRSSQTCLRTACEEPQKNLPS